MKPWLRLTLITMTVGGGFAGFVSTLQSLFNSLRASTLNLLLTVVFMGLYAFVTASGLLFVPMAMLSECKEERWLSFILKLRRNRLE